MRRPVFVLACAVIAVTSVAVRPATAAPPDVRADADWLLSVQTVDGAIAMGVDKTWVVPYFANIGARGLARASAVTGVARYADAAFRWLLWYQARMDASGFVTDYRASTRGGWASTGDMDSTDSYAATFLTAVRELWLASRSPAQMLALRSGVARAASAIEATTDRDGLTWAKPTWAWKYLMDNAEVYEGWNAAREIAVVTGDLTLEAKARRRAEAIAAAFPRYRNASAGGYDWGIDGVGGKAVLDWRQLYPSVAAQAWPVFAGLVSRADAAPLMARLDREQPGWDRPFANAVIVDRVEPAGYWPDIARAFLVAGDARRAFTGYRRILADAERTRRAWPFHPGTAGAMIALASDPQIVALAAA